MRLFYMTTDEKKRFTVISNENFGKKTDSEERHKSYQTDPLRERFVKFVNEEKKRKFSVEDLLKW